MDTIIIKGLSALEDAASELIEQFGDHKVIAFYGDMGAGKTTLISEICQLTGVTERISSPSFSIVNEYETKDGETIYHFDFYRIKDLEEAFDFGYEEYFYSGNLCLVEWPEKIEELLPDNTLKLQITAIDENIRTITLK